MPRNPSGDYTLPAGNPVVGGTTIDVSWANPTMEDLGNEMTDSLSRNGEGAMLVPLRVPDGTQAAPGYTWEQEQTSGFYRNGTNTFSYSVDNNTRFQFTLNRFAIDGDNPSLGGADAALITGTIDPTNDPHIAYGLNTIQAKLDATNAATLFLNSLGGLVQIATSAQTTLAANGGLLVNNTLTGPGYERVLTESDLNNPPPPVTGYEGTNYTYLDDDGVNTSDFVDFATEPEGIADTIGATGSGASVIWTALDAIPSDAVSITVMVLIEAEANAATGGVQELALFAGPTASSVTFFANRIAYLEFGPETGSGTEAASMQEVQIKLEPGMGRLFHFSWSEQNTDARGLRTFLKGFSI